MSRIHLLVCCALTKPRSVKEKKRDLSNMHQAVIQSTASKEVNPQDFIAFVTPRILTRIFYTLNYFQIYYGGGNYPVRV